MTESDRLKVKGSSARVTNFEYSPPEEGFPYFFIYNGHRWIPNVRVFTDDWNEEVCCLRKSGEKALSVDGLAHG